LRPRSNTKSSGNDFLPVIVEPLSPILTPPFDLLIDVVYVIFVVCGVFGVFVVFGILLVVSCLTIEILLSAIEPAFDAPGPVLLFVVNLGFGGHTHSGRDR
jgi:hypothetical protein